MRSDSTDTESLRDLGYLLLQQEEFDAAGPLLERAHVLKPDDPFVHYYYGLYLEHASRTDDAEALYAHFRDLPNRGRYRTLCKLMAGRHAALRRKEIRAKFQARSDSIEALIGPRPEAHLPTNTVAVFPIRFDGGDPRFAPLGRGLSALLMIDLGHVEQIEVLERLRLQVLIDELRLSETEAVAGSAAPRVGHLLRARRVIGGRFTVSEDERVKLDLDVREIEKDELKKVVVQDQLRQFFVLEKDLVFRLLEEMGIEPSEAERRRIEYIPTRDMNALLAYSMGLREEDAGRFGDAARLFGRAATIDPGFEAALDRAVINEGLQSAGSPLDAVRSGDIAPPSIGREDLVRRRHGNQGETIGSLAVPGQDKRDEGPVLIEETIPVPPAPPGGQ